MFTKSLKAVLQQDISRLRAIIEYLIKITKIRIN
jgi:hypothetical protein